VPLHDGGVLIEANHLTEFRRMFGVGAFCITETRGAAHALAPHVNTPSGGEPHADDASLTNPTTPTGGTPHADDPSLTTPTLGGIHALASLLRTAPYA
jgi:hypothetical protein